MGRDYIKMNRFNGFSSLFFITFKKELKIPETVKTVRNTYKDRGGCVKIQFLKFYTFKCILLNIY